MVLGQQYKGTNRVEGAEQCKRSHTELFCRVHHGPDGIDDDMEKRDCTRQ